MSRPKKTFENYPCPKSRPKRPQNAKTTQKSKSNVRIEGNIEIKVVILYEHILKQFLNLIPTLSLADLGRKNSKKSLKLGQNQNKVSWE